MAPASHSLDRWRIAQAAPVHALEARRHLLGQPGGQAGLADAAHAQHRHQPTALLQHPAVAAAPAPRRGRRSRRCRALHPSPGRARPCSRVRRVAPVGRVQLPAGVEGRARRAGRRTTPRRTGCACAAPRARPRPTARALPTLSRPAVSPPASSNARISAWSRSAVGSVTPASQSCTERRLTPARREVALDQSGPPAMAQEQAAKRIRRVGVSITARDTRAQSNSAAAKHLAGEGSRVCPRCRAHDCSSQTYAKQQTACR